MSTKSPILQAPAPKRQGGFSLMEALVSILVLSIGLLGVAALQSVGLRANSGAAHRSQAAWLAMQIVEDARAQRAETLALNSALVDKTVTPKTCGANETTPINRWRARIACALPEGAGAVDYDTYTQRLTVTVRWNDSRGVDHASTGGNTAANFTIETVL